MRTSRRSQSRGKIRNRGQDRRVNSDGQLYTIEGIAAGLLMILTAYLVVSATSVYTAGDTHINDMQLEQLGSDALKIMDTPETKDGKSPLREIIEGTPTGMENATFGSMFMNLANSKTGISRDRIQYTASYTCRIDPGTEIISNNSLWHSRNLTGGEHAVRVTKWVTVNKGPVLFCGTTNKDRAVLVEVLMWRD
jgi:hypothetical protein